jgi:hypothetical protein
MDADHAGVRTSFIGRLDSANPSLRLAAGYLSSSPLTPATESVSPAQRFVSASRRIGEK